MTRSLLFTLLALAATLTSHALTPERVRWHNEARDTTMIQAILADYADAPAMEPQQYIPSIARRFMGKPYVAGTLERKDGGEEVLTVNLDQLDCTTFIETVMALAMSAADGGEYWEDYIDNLESLRYRAGTLDGYPSRLHYVSDWIADNTARGNLVEVTAEIPGATPVTKTLNFMSTHRGSYPALKTDDDNLAAIRSIEEGYRNHRYHILPKSRLLNNKATIDALREGDIVALTTDIPGLDVSHFAIITMVNGKPHMLHASSTAGKVIIDPLTIGQYLNRSKHATGIRVIRLAAH